MVIIKLILHGSRTMTRFKHSKHGRTTTIVTTRQFPSFRKTTLNCFFENVRGVPISTNRDTLSARTIW